MDIERIEKAAIALRENNCEENYIAHINESCPENVLELIRQLKAALRRNLELEEYERAAGLSGKVNMRLMAELQEAANQIFVANKRIEDSHKQVPLTYLWRHNPGTFASDIFESKEYAEHCWRQFSRDGVVIPVYALPPIPAQDEPQCAVADDQEQLLSLLKDLLSVANGLFGAPHYVCAPFFNIVKRNHALIGKYNLFSESSEVNHE